ncbi:dephospho-CoA kinase [Rhodobacter capsulatus]|uniref:Dephospho-CoA kinase n=1 Tax=Rhodobacter capsulatus TaxID=1061 RepID=A0A4U1K2F3_RHOCA|nr:dephospho-CoA kinase [Rhodobacter capsulatus]TKD26201.1 dephospho-CoA kinase [Rhodobacter capsulatus]
MSRPFRLGLTGSIGMGKSTTARLFAEEDIPVWDADATVHALYAKGGAAVAPLSAIFPAAIRDGAVDRDLLKTLLQADKQALSRLEFVVHPLVQAARQAFLLSHATEDLILLDIPLLYETGADKDCDAVLVVTAAPDVQRARVLARGQMTEAQLDMILARQLPDAEKRRRADHVIETFTLEQTRSEVRKLIATLRSRHA